MHGLTAQEQKLLKKLNTPAKLQDFLNSLPFNFEPRGDTLMSPRRVLSVRKAHCFEGALLAAAALWAQGHKPLLLDLVPDKKKDDGHVVALYRLNGYWGALSKTNHAVLRFRDPIYRTVRELALSYFHEYFLNTTGEKTLRSFAGPIDMRQFDLSWLTSEEDLTHLHQAFDDLPHEPFVPAKNKGAVRPADPVERKAGAIVEQKRR